MTLMRDDSFVVPISTFNEPDRDPPAMGARPGDDLAQVCFAVLKIGLQGQTALRHPRKFRLGKNRFEEPQREVFERVALHVEIDESGKFDMESYALKDL